MLHPLPSPQACGTSRGSGRIEVEVEVLEDAEVHQQYHRPGSSWPREDDARWPDVLEAKPNGHFHGATH